MLIFSILVTKICEKQARFLLAKLNPSTTYNNEVATDGMDVIFLDMTVRDALNSALDEEMVVASSVFIMGEEVKNQNPKDRKGMSDKKPNSRDGSVRQRSVSSKSCRRSTSSSKASNKASIRSNMKWVKPNYRWVPKSTLHI
ncbi:hypothetical protein Lser_V15G09234 [Lactuca serriola]